MDQPSGRTIKVLIGQVAMTRAPNVLQSVLGSCVGVVVYDQVNSLAGMAHVFLPDSGGAAPGVLPGKFANHAISCLSNGLVQHGAARINLRAKLTGGARMFDMLLSNGSDIGATVTQAVKAALAQERIPIVAAEIGGVGGRRVSFEVATCRYVVVDFNERTTVI